MESYNFDNKKVLVIVPHEDDEICVTGGILASLPCSCKKYVIYTTNGNYIYRTKTRYMEAIKSCKILGVKKENIIFLGYSDESYNGKNHMYNTDEIWTDKYGNTQTSSTKNIREYCYAKTNNHNKFTKENIIKDLKSCISEIMPDYIFCVDLDFHPDHIMTSLCFEKAMGKILHENVNYHPIVFKGFAYENAYLGPNDFNQEKVIPMQFNYIENRLVSNPYYTKENSINFNINSNTYTRNLRKNILYKAIKQHKSQLLVAKAFSLINPNVIYWSRNTNNLLNVADIKVSSGNKEYLNDFVINDTSNVLNGNKEKIIYDKGIWIPDKRDNKKEINIKFNDYVYVEEMNIYNGNNNQKFVGKIKIMIDDESKTIDNNKYILNLKINKKVKNINITILDKIINNGFSEIEILDSTPKSMSSNIKFVNNEKYNLRVNELINKIGIFVTKCYRKLFIRKKIL